MIELDKKLEEYGKRFSDGFPTIPLMLGRTDEEVIEIIDDCLKKGKDVYELGYVEDKEGLFY